MSNQVEQIRAEVERRIKSWAAGIKYEGDAGDCQSRVTELTDLKKFIDSLPAKENPILVPESKETPIEVCGKKVVVRYARTQEDACASCAFCSRKECHDLDCNMRDIIGESVSKYAYFAEPWIRCSDCALFLGGKCTRPGGECARKAPLSEEIHSLQEWAKIMAEHPELRTEFDKMCPPQPIRGSIAPEADVNKHAVKHAFLHCDKAGKIVSEMYGDKINNSRNIDKYLAFLKQVELDDRFGELAEILQRYGAMPAPKQQPEADLEAEIDKKVQELHTAPCYNELAAFARHFVAVGATMDAKKKRVTMSGFYSPISPNRLVNIPDLANKGALFQDAGFEPGEPVEITIEAHNPKQK